MMEAALAVFALAYSATVLFALSGSLRKRMAPRRAVLAALGISAAVHGATLFFAPADQRALFLAFWAIPHLLLAPVLFWMARKPNGH